MIHDLKEVLASTESKAIREYLREQVSNLLNISMEGNSLNEFAHTNYVFVDVCENMVILGIIVISCKLFMFGKEIFFIETIVSSNNDSEIEQLMLLKGISFISNNVEYAQIISLVDDERIQTEVLNHSGFTLTNFIMTKFLQ